MKAFLPLLSVLFLAACGFAPIYGDHGADRAPVAEALGKVQIENIPDRNGQFLRNHLIDRLYMKGRPVSPETKLSIHLSIAEQGLGIQKDATASRNEMNVSAHYVLTDNVGKVLLKGTARASVSFSQLSAQYGTLAAKEDASRRALRETGEEIVNRLSLYFAEGGEEIEKPKAKKEEKLRKEGAW